MPVFAATVRVSAFILDSGVDFLMAPESLFKLIPF
jgi:hypothetical protein